MKKPIVRMLLALAVVLTSLTVAAAPASAATSRTALRKAASAVAFEKVGGGKYAAYKRNPKFSHSLNWGHDGCSVPKRLAKLAKTYNKIFVHSCDRHDFGYRNFGKNTRTKGPHPKLSATWAVKNAIDTRFLTNMMTNCNQKYHWYNPQRQVCHGVAKVYYGAVAASPQGFKAFFG